MHSIVTTFRGAVIKVEFANFCAAMDTLEVANFCAAMDTLTDQDDSRPKPGGFEISKI